LTPRPQPALNPAHDFRRTVWLTIAGTAAPGLGLIAARRRVVGGVVLGLFVTVFLTLGLWAAVDLKGLASMAVRPAVLNALTVVLIVVALVWVGVVIASHLSLRHQPNRAQRIGGGILVGVLAFAVAAPLGVAAQYSHVQAGAINMVFKSEKDTKSATRPTLRGNPTAGGQPQQDPWANKPRLNILLLGGDDGQGKAREGTGTRTDTVILASIDTKTGDTTMFSLPRNTARMPFPMGSPLRRYYPSGFTNGDGSNGEYMLNAMYRNVPNTVPPNILGETDNLGADVLKISVGEALGVNIDYYALINLKGFQKMINALGGITVNVNSYIPIGGNTDRQIPPKEWISPGPDKRLDGRNALWFARSRWKSSDYARMDRQRCVINAIIKQANPANVLARYEDIAKAGQEIIKTDMPQEVLPLMVDLGMRVKDGNVRSIVFKNDTAGFISANPDFDLIRQRVKVAIGEAKAKPTNKSAPRPTTASTSSPTTPSTAPTESEDVESSCAWQPGVAATSQPR
jgi:LCP family protein required for cell wall assembly